LINSPCPNPLRLMPALTISEDEIDQGLELLREALAVVEPTRD
jgi:4-aminobutyrate aminotransferase-like enzyme